MIRLIGGGRIEFVGKIGWFLGSVRVIVLVLAQQS
jgi:hypothetical protein